MNKQVQTTRKMARDIMAQKGGEPLVCLTSYTSPMAQLLDKYVDLMLVGDSLAMVLYGQNSTLNMPLDVMIRHTKTVVDSSQQACVVIDMPFASYQESPQQAYRNCARAMAESGAQAVKLEGGVEMAETIKFLQERGIPVMGHVGLRPQSLNTAGGFKVQGKGFNEAEKIKQDAVAIYEAGVFSMVIEAVPEALAAEITQMIPVPTIGIGASSVCDGQILVTEDMLGLTPGKKPKFVKVFADLAGQIDQAVEDYANEVKNRQFPSKENVYQSPRIIKGEKAS